MFPGDTAPSVVFPLFPAPCVLHYFQLHFLASWTQNKQGKSQSWYGPHGKKQVFLGTWHTSKTGKYIWEWVFLEISLWCNGRWHCLRVAHNSSKPHGQQEATHRERSSCGRTSCTWTMTIVPTMGALTWFSWTECHWTMKIHSEGLYLWATGISLTWKKLGYS